MAPLHLLVGLLGLRLPLAVKLQAIRLGSRCASAGLPWA
jgi:hypothetical protein